MQTSVDGWLLCCRRASSASASAAAAEVNANANADADANANATRLGFCAKKGSSMDTYQR